GWDRILRQVIRLLCTHQNSNNDNILMKIPTDREILDDIYTRYYNEFKSFNKDGNNSRLSKVYVPIDVDAIAAKFGVDGDVIFGRLYYYFNNKYGYTNSNGSKVPFFQLELGPTGKKDRHCVNFPLMASVLAGLIDESKDRFIRWQAV